MRPSTTRRKADGGEAQALSPGPGQALSPMLAPPAWRDAHVKPLWEIEQAHRPDGDLGGPVIWPWRTMAPLVQRAIELASPASAERRVLSLIDPTGREGDFQTTTNLNAG